MNRKTYVADRRQHLSNGARNQMENCQADDLTDPQIKALRDEAAAHGDGLLVAYCETALGMHAVSPEAWEHAKSIVADTINDGRCND